MEKLRNLRMILSDDSRFRALLGLIAVACYFGPPLLGLIMVIFGPFQFEDARALNGIWVLGLGPIVGAVIGYYFGGTTSTVDLRGKRLVALVVTFIFFLPTCIMAVLGTLQLRNIASFREYLEFWIVFSGPITGVIYGSYSSTRNNANTHVDSNE